MDLFELTKSLVNMASVTGHEKACGEFIKGYLVQLGFQAELMPVSRDRSNVFATWGKPDVVLSTHMDTVPPFFPAHEDADNIYGRGSCDAKGILAAQVTAAERLKKDGVENIALLFLVGEETVSDGAREANLHPRGSRYIINGEPTDNKLVIGSKGNLRIDIRARGKMAHSAYPHLGVNAIDKLLDVLEELRKIALPVSPVLGQSTMNIGCDHRRPRGQRRTRRSRGADHDSHRGKFGAPAAKDYGNHWGPLRAGLCARHAGAADGEARWLRNGRCGVHH